MSELTNHLRLAREVDMQSVSPPLAADFNRLHEPVTWLTKELEVIRYENE